MATAAAVAAATDHGGGTASCLPRYAFGAAQRAIMGVVVAHRALLSAFNVATAMKPPPPPHTVPALQRLALMSPPDLSLSEFGCILREAVTAAVKKFEVACTVNEARHLQLLLWPPPEEDQSPVNVVVATVSEFPELPASLLGTPFESYTWTSVVKAGGEEFTVHMLLPALLVRVLKAGGNQRVAELIERVGRGDEGMPVRLPPAAKAAALLCRLEGVSPEAPAAAAAASPAAPSLARSFLAAARRGAITPPAVVAASVASFFEVLTSTAAASQASFQEFAQRFLDLEDLAPVVASLQYPGDANIPELVHFHKCAKAWVQQLQQISGGIPEGMTPLSCLYNVGYMSEQLRRGYHSALLLPFLARLMRV